MVGLWSTIYCHGSDFNNQASLAQNIRAREIIPCPDTGIEDTTSYLLSGEKLLSLGARLEGRIRATTCGVRVKKSNGSIRITSANYGFLSNGDKLTPMDNEVWHLDGNGDLIGMIKERYAAQDIALFEPTEGLPFSSTSYFAAEAPKRLIKGKDIKNGAWFEADGMSTGMAAFQCIGRYVGYRKTRKHSLDIYPEPMLYLLSFSVLYKTTNNATKEGQAEQPTM